MGSLISIPVLSDLAPDKSQVISGGVESLAGDYIGAFGSVAHDVYQGRFSGDSRGWYLSLNPFAVARYAFSVDKVVTDTGYNIVIYDRTEIYAIRRYGAWIVVPESESFSSQDEMLADFLNRTIIKPVKIDYQGINVSFNGQETADWGEQVVIDVLPDSGMIVQDPTQGKSISVYNENGYIPFVYANGKITFTVPNAPTNVG